MNDTLVHSLQQSAAVYPNAEAIVSNNKRVTFAQLWSDVNGFAMSLQSEGLEKGDRVAILLENSPEYVTAYYGALASGACVVGLNTAAKYRDIANWLNHCGATWLVADAAHPELVDIVKACTSRIRLIIVGEEESPGELFSDIQTYRWEDVLAKKGRLETSAYPCPTDLATIIYTSGTTGRPKGVTLTHNNLARNISSILQYLELTSEDKILNVLPFYYSYGNSVLHTHIVAGGCIVLENSLLYPQRVMEKMQSEKVTGFSGVPSTFSLLMNRTKLRDFNLSAMRYMTQAGGPMAPASISRLLDDLPHIRFFVMYGQTEATARLSYLPPNMLSKKMGSIGIGIPGVELEIRDEHGAKTPVNVTGEIYARGENIMQGYWNDPELTAQVVKNGWLKTGDLAHVDEDGYIYIDGRSSEMIKSGAHRINPKEIEEVILELQGIEEVGVVGLPDEMLGEIIKAVVVQAPGNVVEKKKILAHCRKNLAMYKIPKIIEFSDNLPKTPSGKLRRFLLKN
jgi:acyl-CoA synthetase (AMP-forming)/AMP-acid ligase II